MEGGEKDRKGEYPFPTWGGGEGAASLRGREGGRVPYTSILWWVYKLSEMLGKSHSTWSLPPHLKWIAQQVFLEF